MPFAFCALNDRLSLIDKDKPFSFMNAFAADNAVCLSTGDANAKDAIKMHIAKLVIFFNIYVNNALITT